MDAVLRLLNLIMIVLTLTFLMLGRWVGGLIFLGLLVIGLLTWGLRLPVKAR